MFTGRLAAFAPSDSGDDLDAGQVPMSATRAAADVIALKAPNFHILDFEFHADFHDLRARNLEICAGPLGIVVHECK